MGNQNSCKNHHHVFFSSWFVAVDRLIQVKTNRNYEVKDSESGLSGVKIRFISKSNPTKRTTPKPPTFFLDPLISFFHQELYAAASFSALSVAGAEVRMIWGEELEDGCVIK